MIAVIGRTARTVRRVLAVAATVALTGTLAATPASAATSARLCGRAHVAQIGWQAWQCVTEGGTIQLGTTGRALSIEAVQLRAYGPTTRVCARAHVQDVGWQASRCATSGGTTLTVGTTGQGKRMEALSIWTNANDGWAVAASGHAAMEGWQGWWIEAGSNQGLVGTTGRGLGLEAVRLRVVSA